jgi:curved DNA-binding protein CbpA
MPDHFAALHQPRRPWLDDAALKEAFHRATTEHHPDISRDSGEKSAALNAAYGALREPALRLKHLLELEWPDAPPAAASISGALAEMFGKLAGIRQRRADLLKKEASAQSPLTRALLVEQRTACRQEIETTLTALNALEAVARAELQTLDTHWEQRDESTRARLVATQQQFAYLAKWQAQLREDLFQLSA